MISFDAAYDGYKAAVDTAALTYSHTAAARTKLYLWVGVGNSRTVTATYGGVSMSLIGTETETNGDIIYLYAISVEVGGAANIIVTPSGTTFIIAHSATYKEVSPTVGQVHNIGCDAVALTSLTNTINITDPDAWMISVCGFERTPTASTGAVLRHSNGAGNMYLFDTNGVIGATGNKSMSYTFASVGAQIAIAVELLPDRPGFFAML